MYGSLDMICFSIACNMKNIIYIYNILNNTLLQYDISSNSDKWERCELNG